MPIASTLALIGTIVGLGATGTELGMSLANRPGTPKTPTTPAAPAQQSQASQDATQNQQKALINQQLPDILSNTSGLVNPEYAKQMAELLSGTAGQSGATGAASSAVSSAFGLPSFGGAGGKGDFVPAGAGNANSGGSANASTNPVALSDFLNSYLS